MNDSDGFEKFIVEFGKAMIDTGARDARAEIAALREQLAAVTGDAWQDDPAADERWNAGCGHAIEQLAAVLGIDRNAFSWDAATEELGGDVRSVIGNALTEALGDDWDALRERAETAEERVRVLETLLSRVLAATTAGAESEATLMVPYDDAAFKANVDAVTSGLFAGRLPSLPLNAGSLALLGDIRAALTPETKA
jgi:hypothetical protein